MASSIDYTRDDIWDALAERFERHWEPRPTEQVGRVVCAPDWTWRPQLRDYDLWYVAGGRGTLRLGPDTFAVKAGTLLFLRPGDSGWATHEPADPLTVVYIHFDFYAPLQPRRVDVDGCWLPSRSIDIAQPQQFEALLTRIVGLLETPRQLARLDARLALQQALLEVYRQDARRSAASWWRDPALERVLSYVRSHPEQRPTLAAAAALAGLAPDYFSRRFTATVGLSFREYCLRNRLERARYLLEETELPINRIAAALGYNEALLLSRQFRERYGVAPRELRRRAHKTTGSVQV